MIRILSLGAGVQSSTLALMMAQGELPAVDHAIFADTGAEPATVYRWLAWLTPQLPFPVHQVSNGNLREAVMQRVRQEKTGSAGPPFFTSDAGMLPRQCTRDYKLIPIERKIRELLGLKPGQRGPSEIVGESVLGISYDEALRMKASRLSFVRNVYPLVERELTRWHCLEWMKAQGYPKPPKSACTFCPYHSDEQWQELKNNDPEAFADAIAIDEAIRGGFIATTKRLYVHAARQPLAIIDLRTPAQFGQLDAFTNECEGMCGV